MWAFNCTNEINFKAIKIFLDKTKNGEKSGARTKCLEEVSAGEQEIGSSPASHIRTRHKSSCTVGFSHIGFGKPRYPFPESQETHQVTLSPFTYDPHFCARATKTGTLVWEFILPQVWKADWISNVSASWQQTEFKMQNVLWKSEKVKRRKKRGFLLEKERKFYRVLIWKIL